VDGSLDLSMTPAHIRCYRGSWLDAALVTEIRQRRHAPDLEQRGDVLSQLLLARDDEGRAMTDDEVRDELVTLLFAGPSCR
jgi:cytochrome P450